MNHGTSQDLDPNQMTFYFAEEHHVNPSQSQDSEKDSVMNGETSHSHSLNLQTSSTRTGSSGKTYRESLVQKTTHLDAFWQDFAERVNPTFHSKSGQSRVWCLDPKELLPGGFRMLNTMEWPNADGGSLLSLSQVLITGNVPKHYFLSEKACSGILRRAEKRQKKLPEMLEKALKEVVEKANP